MEIWYVTDAAYNYYRQDEQQFATNGYVILAENVTTAEVNYIYHHFPNLLVKKGRRTCIRKADLDQLRLEIKEQPRRLTNPPRGALSSYANSYSGHRRLVRDIHSGRLRAVKSGKFWTVTPEAMEEYRRKKSISSGENTNGTGPVVVFDASKI